MYTGGVPGLIWLVKRLKGAQPEKVTEANTEELEIETKEGKFRIGKLTWRFYNSRLIRKSIHGVLKPLSQPGVESVKFIDQQQRISVVEKDDVRLFIPPEESKEQLLELPLRDTYVNVVHMWFKDGHKWRFTEGSGEWTAEITDANFINRLVKGEVSIRASDFLKVRVKQTQFIQGTDISSVYEIIEVLDHKRGDEQMSLI